MKKLVLTSLLWLVTMIVLTAILHELCDKFNSAGFITASVVIWVGFAIFSVICWLAANNDFLNVAMKDKTEDKDKRYR